MSEAYSFDVQDDVDDHQPHPVTAEEATVLHVELSDDALKDYLKQIGKIPQLDSKEREAELCNVIEAGKLAEEEIAQGTWMNPKVRNNQTPNQIALVWRAQPRQGDRPIPTLDELEYLSEQGRQAKELMIVANLRMVVNIAKHYQGRGMALLDLIQEGNTGLEHAVDMYDHTQGQLFITYAKWWVRKNIVLALADQAKMTSLPVHIYEATVKLRGITQHYLQTQGREPTVAELANNAGLSQAKVEEYKSLDRIATSLDRPSDEDREESLGALIEDSDTAGPFDISVANLFLDGFERVLGELSTRERTTLEMYHGLGGQAKESLRAIGKAQGISHVAVRHFLLKTNNKLRHSPEFKQLMDFLD
jgi:RNA polymerase primary sigma factor